MYFAADWYHGLTKPSWTPPDVVFGIVWGILYPIIIAVNVWVLWAVWRRKMTWRQALPFWANAVLNIAFTPVQFGLRNNYITLVLIVLLLGTIVWAIVQSWRQYRWLSIAFVPYLVWVSIATTLQANITWLNR